MKKQLTALVMAVCIGLFTQAAEIDSQPLMVNIAGNYYAPYFNVECGAMNVKMNEWVFRDSAGDAKISAINFNMGMQGGFRLGLGFEPFDKLRKIGLGVNAAYASYLPTNRGKMSDSDWDYDGRQYSFGVGTASSINFSEIEGKLLLYIPFGKIAALGLMAKLWYSRYAAVASDGWIQQVNIGEPWSDSIQKVSLYGVSMMYIQEWLSLAPGFGVWIQKKRHSLNLSATVWGGVWGSHLDYHYFKQVNPNEGGERYVIYEDKVKGIISASIEAEWMYLLKRYGEIGIRAGYKSVPLARGDTFIKTAGLIDDRYYDANMAGASMTQLYGSLVYRLWL
jgi:outer membrane protease